VSEVAFPENEFTQMIERLSSDNRSGVRGAGVASATPMPTAQSADLGRVVPDRPLTPEERATLDRMAVEAGVRDERLPGSAEAQPTYQTLEEAIRAGAAVEDTVVRVPVGARNLAPLPSVPRMPDFRRVEGIDLERGLALVDGMSFPIPPEMVAEYKLAVVEVARDAIMEKLEEAVGLFARPETAEGTDGGVPTRVLSEVQQQPAGGGEEPPV
jgi:hypothetical protein